ncbi:MAG: hypothetical protein GC157_06095 [Frankiales bacterium]|nr:hypothetical protein [Frankiales bacterium]
MASIEFTARRWRADFTTYHWRLAPARDADARKVVLLRNHERASWPDTVRACGITDLGQVGFTDMRERALFALDCDLIAADR